MISLSWTNIPVRKKESSTYDVFDSQMMEPEDNNFSNPQTDNTLRRTNPPRFDKRKDFLNIGNDDEISERTEQTQLFSSRNWRKIFKIQKVNTMNNWRKVLAATFDITKKDVADGSKFKPFKNENKVEIPNRAEFTGDKFPSTGDSSKKELDAWKKQNKQFDKNKKKEDSPQQGSSVLLDKRVETLDDKLSDNNTFASITGGIVSIPWRKVLADVQVEKKPDGTVKVNVQETPPAPEHAQTPAEGDQTQQTAQASLNAVASWEIRKEGSYSLIGKECTTHCGIAIMNGDKEEEFSKIAKNGHVWNELINQAVWEAKFDTYINNKK